MNIYCYWQTVRIGQQCLKTDHVHLQTKDYFAFLEINNAYSARVTIHPDLKAVLYEKPEFQGDYQIVFADYEIGCIQQIGSLRLMSKKENEYELAYVLINNPQTNRVYTTYLPRGVYNYLSTCGFVDIVSKCFRIDKFHDLVQIVGNQEEPAAVVQFKSGEKLNCYHHITYDDIAITQEADILLSPGNTLVIKQDEQDLRIMQSVNGFKPLGALVHLEVGEQLLIDYLAVKFIDLSVASLQQLVIILFVTSLVAAIVAYKLKQTLADVPTPDSLVVMNR